ncbi:hypothetical protein BZG11_14560 [Salinivibrio kushneri]|uniref:DUF2971 domain-containing protein n=1 Tax=Salinivibrio kushneri TaxID=1908198 RepID=UPI000989970A|nr:DUF2971 domain-containing protein [Salinivibrio kushneri]OOE48454.1 hypothetical protein BZG11_14560 [Salinivibrio kushneri]
MALYKFQTANMNSQTALRTHSLFFSKLENLNDPTENMFGILPIEEKIDPRVIPDINELQKCSLLCMGTDSENFILESDLLMWTHYGAELSGICLVFDDEILKKVLKTMVVRRIKKSSMVIQSYSQLINYLVSIWV